MFVDRRVNISNRKRVKTLTKKHTKNKIGTWQGELILFSGNVLSVELVYFT